MKTKIVGRRKELKRTRRGKKREMKSWQKCAKRIERSFLLSKIKWTIEMFNVLLMYISNGNELMTISVALKWLSKVERRRKNIKKEKVWLSILKVIIARVKWRKWKWATLYINNKKQQSSSYRLTAGNFIHF